MCPVDLIDSYLIHRKSLGHNSDRDLLFPQVDDRYQGIRPSFFYTIQIPKVSITLDIYRNRLKRHLNCETFKAMGIYPEDFLPILLGWKGQVR